MGNTVDVGNEWVILSEIFKYLICVIINTMRRVKVATTTYQYMGAPEQGQYDSECYHH